MIVEKLFKIPFPKKEKIEKKLLLNYYHQSSPPKFLNNTPLSIYVACGPYTLYDNLNFEPLESLISHIVQNKPDIVILNGPFVDSEHKLIKSGKPYMEIENDDDGDDTIEKVYLSYDDIMTVFCARISNIYENNKNINTKIIMIPSTSEITHSHYCYPQPPINLPPNSFPQNILNKYIKLYPNPCNFKINEITIGISNNDIIADTISDYVRSNNIKTQQTNLKNGKMLGIAEEIIKQQNYYPLFPSKDSSLVDITQMNKYQINKSLDMLILPSKLPTFTGELNDKTIVINPGKVGSGKKIFSKIDILPFDKEILEKADDNVKFNIELTKRTIITPQLI